MVKAIFLGVLVAAASPALGQASQQQSSPQQQPAAQPPPPATQQPPAQQPQSQSTAGSQGQSSSAQPSSPGAASQQVVVNPPPSQQPSVPQSSPPPSTTTVVNPPPSYSPGPYSPSPGYAQDDIVVHRRAERRNPLMTVATDAAYGGLAGLVIGFGVALVNQWDHWERDITVGTGAGVLVGAAVGVAQAAYDASDDRKRVASDGMNRTDKDPVIATRPTMAFGFKF
jgi:hypothetical protein